MHRLKFNLSIRLKIILLIAGTAALSLSSYLYIGTRLLIDDKISYIFDYNFAQMRSAAAVVNNRVERVLFGGRALGPLGAAAREKAYAQYAKSTALTGIIFLHAGIDAKLETAGAYGAPQAEMEATVTALGWTVDRFKSAELLIGRSRVGGIVVGGSSVDSNGEPLYFVAFTQFDRNNLTLGFDAKDIEVRVFDESGSQLFNQGEVGISKPESAELLGRLAKEVFQAVDQLKSGVRELNVEGSDFIIAYDRVAGNHILVMSIIHKSVAFAATHALVSRSVVLGVSILLLAIGTGLLLVRNLIWRIRQLWEATQKVSAGDFNCHVEVSTHGADELSSLGGSFNSMAEKITELLAETEKKVRMEKELETAQALQNQFFPNEPFHHPDFKITGKIIPASECGGDWWLYSQIGPHLLVLVGDVTGHGVSSALVTAAAHGAFSMIAKSLREDQSGAAPSLKAVVQNLNTAVRAAAGEQSGMTLLASMLNLETGELQIINASHRPPYVYCPSSGGFNALIKGRCAQLGLEDTIDPSPETYCLKPGDLIFMYTDGVLECTNNEGKVLPKSEVREKLIRLYHSYEGDCDSICSDFLKESTEFFGEKPAGLEDDVTVIVGVVSGSAQFKAAA
jgi:sigma-B regulation protein RsbU (phosphoserine phosphatase)